MKIPKQKPEAVVRAFEEWIKKGRRRGVIQPAPVRKYKNITPEHYSTGLFYVFFNELCRRDPSFQEIADSSLKKFTERYSRGLMLKLAFPPEWHWNWGGIYPHLFHPFKKLLFEKWLVRPWSQPESISADRFENTLCDCFRYELMRRGKVKKNVKKREFQSRYCDIRRDTNA